MKVKELIKELEKFDWDMEVVVYDREEHTYDDVFTFKKKARAYTENKWKRKWIDIYEDMEQAKKRTKWVEWVKYDDILVIYADY